MIFSGLTLKFTKIASFVGIIQYLLLFASGTLISLDKLPAALLVLTKVLPINLGLKVSQNPFELTTFLLLILQMIIYMVIGTLTFTYVYNRAKKERNQFKILTMKRHILLRGAYQCIKKMSLFLGINLLVSFAGTLFQMNILWRIFTNHEQLQTIVLVLSSSFILQSIFFHL